MVTADVVMGLKTQNMGEQGRLCCWLRVWLVKNLNIVKVNLADVDRSPCSCIGSSMKVPVVSAELTFAQQSHSVPFTSLRTNFSLSGLVHMESF